jgi:hypothetical protein
MITVLLHTKDNNTNSREERATTLSTEEKKERGIGNAEAHREENRTAKGCSKRDLIKSKQT